MHESLIIFSGIPTKDHSLGELEQAFLKQIERLQTEPISDQELKRIKTNVIAQHIYEQDLKEDQALQLGLFEAIGLSWKMADNYPTRIQAITAQDVMKVAQKYLTLDRLTIAELIPIKAN